jgi:hypothetical protein
MELNIRTTEICITKLSELEKKVYYNEKIKIKIKKILKKMCETLKEFTFA